ncbi:MAG: sigma-70 family RNA polymerase sigma factor [Phycisphaerales bacterium]|nr:MAG: sigma-70 family RNA polymerase sigma factor [Phycisphaerales bacterium]
MTYGNTTHLSFLLRLRDRADKLGWNEFHDKYGQLLYRYARSRGASHVNAEDVVQEVEMYLFRAIDSLEYNARRGRFRTYLRAAVVHALARQASKEAQQPSGLDPHAFKYLAGQEEANADEQWQREWRFHRLRSEMRSVADTFEPMTLKAFEMHALGGRSVIETAEILGLTKWSVYQAKSRILKCLKARLAAKEMDRDL